jgi:hypothetical protein
MYSLLTTLVPQQQAAAAAWMIAMQHFVTVASMKARTSLDCLAFKLNVDDHATVCYGLPVTTVVRHINVDL